MQAMEWQTPSFREIDMSAEIGAYAPDMPAQDPVQRIASDGDIADCESAS
jgi:coenzyme PQQ precursor peptide PqqA